MSKFCSTYLSVENIVIIYLGKKDVKFSSILGVSIVLEIYLQTDRQETVVSGIRTTPGNEDGNIEEKKNSLCYGWPLPPSDSHTQKKKKKKIVNTLENKERKMLRVI